MRVCGLKHVRQSTGPWLFDGFMHQRLHYRATFRRAWELWPVFAQGHVLVAPCTHMPSRFGQPNTKAASSLPELGPEGAQGHVLCRTVHAYA